MTKNTTTQETVFNQCAKEGITESRRMISVQFKCGHYETEPAEEDEERQRRIALYYRCVDCYVAMIKKNGPISD